MGILFIKRFGNSNNNKKAKENTKNNSAKRPSEALEETLTQHKHTHTHTPETQKEWTFFCEFVP